MEKEENRGRPPHIKTEQNQRAVSLLVARGLTSFEIGDILGFSKRTLHKYYQKELDTGRVEWHNAIFSALAKKIQEGDTSCIIFACKTQLGFSEKLYLEHKGKIDVQKEPNVKDVLAEISKINEEKAVTIDCVSDVKND